MENIFKDIKPFEVKPNMADEYGNVLPPYNRMEDSYNYLELFRATGNLYVSVRSFLDKFPVYMWDTAYRPFLYHPSFKDYQHNILLFIQEPDFTHDVREQFSMLWNTPTLFQPVLTINIGRYYNVDENGNLDEVPIFYDFSYEHYDWNGHTGQLNVKNGEVDNKSLAPLLEECERLAILGDKFYPDTRYQ